MEKPQIVIVAASVVTLAAGIAAVSRLYNSVPVPESVKDFHVQEMAPMLRQSNRTEGKVTALTIPPIWESTCDNPDNFEMQELLRERLQEYKALMGRDYGIPPCPE